VNRVRKQFGPADPRAAGILAPLGLSLIQQGKWTDAEPILREALAIREKSKPDEWTTFNTRSLLGGSLLGQKKYDEAEPLIVSGYEGMKAREEKIPPPARPRLTDSAERVVKLYEAWGKKDEAALWRARLAKPANEPKQRPGDCCDSCRGVTSDQNAKRRLWLSAYRDSHLYCFVIKTCAFYPIRSCS
jgi:eukaryotic-like serine/threonine-protein kinase